MAEGKNTVGVIYQHQLKIVSPYPFQMTVDFSLHCLVGDHAMFTLTGVLNEEQAGNLLRSASHQDRLELHHVDGQTIVKTLFMGQLYNYQLEHKRGVYHVTLQSISHTYDLDVECKSRSFQKPGLTYKELVRRVIQDYPGADFIDMASQDAPTGNWWAQIEETDWKFIKRTLSHLDGVLVADIGAHRPRFWFGFKDSAEEVELPEGQYIIKKDLRQYRDIAANYAGIDEPDLIGYEFQTHIYLEIGDCVKIEGRPMYVFESWAVFSNGVLLFRYQLRPHAGIRQNVIGSPLIQGIGLEGTVIDVARNVVKVHLDIDKTQDKAEARWFGYSSEGVNVWYIPPELDARIKLHVMSPWEEDALVINSVRYAPASDKEKDIEDGKMGDPKEKSLRTSEGKEMNLLKEEINFNTKGGCVSLTAHEADGLTLESDSEIKIQSADSITFDDFTEMNMRAEKQMVFVCGETSVVWEKNLHLKSAVLKVSGK
jgi:hypothetical protein